MWMFLTTMERMLVIYPQQQRLWCSDTAVEEERDVFNSNGEVYENACDLPQQQRLWCSDTGCRGGEGCV